MTTVLFYRTESNTIFHKTNFFLYIIHAASNPVPKYLDHRFHSTSRINKNSTFSDADGTKYSLWLNFNDTKIVMCIAVQNQLIFVHTFRCEIYAFLVAIEITAFWTIIIVWLKQTLNNKLYILQHGQQLGLFRLERLRTFWSHLSWEQRGGNRADDSFKNIFLDNNIHA